MSEGLCRWKGKYWEEKNQLAFQKSSLATSSYAFKPCQSTEYTTLGGPVGPQIFFMVFNLFFSCFASVSSVFFKLRIGPIPGLGR